MFDMKDYESKLNELKLDDVLLCQNTSDKPYIITTKGADYNNKAKYKVIDGKYNGGTYLAFPNDIIFAWKTSESLLANTLGIELLRFFEDENIKVTTELNDVLVKDKKLLGTSINLLADGTYYEGLVFSFDTDLDIIKSVCTKEMKKEPIGLSEFNMKPYTVINFCKRMIQEFNLNEID